MVNEKKCCPIWKTLVTHTEADNLNQYYLIVSSPRAGGDYKMKMDAYHDVCALEDTHKAKLTTILIELRRAGDQAPMVTCQLIKEAKRADPLPVHERAERLLRYLVKIPKDVGQSWITESIRHDPLALAWSESTKPEDIGYFLKYLSDMRWLDRYSSGYCNITVSGYQHIAEQVTKRDLSQCFVAMWFDPSMNQAYEDGIEKAVKECGYKPLRIDQKQHLNKIDDEIIAEIRRSRFVVADFTHDAEKGVRGSVYYEAGFAYGLGLPVIYSCHKDLEKELHFDTRQYPHILWETPEDLRIQLRDRIRARVGDYKAEPTPATL